VASSPGYFAVSPSRCLVARTKQGHYGCAYGHDAVIRTYAIGYLSSEFRCPPYKEVGRGLVWA